MLWIGILTTATFDYMVGSTRIDVALSGFILIGFFLAHRDFSLYLY